MGLDEDGVLEAPERGGAVAGALQRDAQAECARAKLDGLGDVVGALRDEDGGRLLVDGEVPRPAGVVPLRVAGEVGLAGGRSVRGGSSALLRFGLS